MKTSGRTNSREFPAAARLWRVTGESGARGRFDSRVVKGLTPLVGRAEEIGLLRRRWDYAKEGDGQLILLSAPAGFGKSRMTQAFREHLGDSSITCLQYFGSPFHVNSPFYPFIRQLEWAAGIVRTDTAVEKLDKLEGILEGSAESKIEAAPLLAALLSIPFGERYPRLQINELVQKQRTMEVLEEQLVLLSSRGPVLVVFEDAHWIDPTSLELMNSVIRRVADLPVMIIVTYRPEFTPPWSDLGHVTVLKLNQLGRSQVVDLIHKAAGGKTLPEAIVEQIAAKSQGVPLFIEEITRSILESGDLEEDGDRYVLRQSIRDFTIPSTLQDSLIARLDRLGSAKDVVLTASIIGREFSYELIEAISSVSQATLLADLGAAGSIRSAGAARHAAAIALHLQACADPRRGLSVGLEGEEARAAPTHRRSARKPVPRSRRNRARTAGAPLYGSKRSRPCARPIGARLPSGRRREWPTPRRSATSTRRRSSLRRCPPATSRMSGSSRFLVIEGPLRMALHGWESPQANRVYEAARVVAERLGRPAELFRLGLGPVAGGAQQRAARSRPRTLPGNLRPPQADRTIRNTWFRPTMPAGSQMMAEGLPHVALAHIEQLLNSYRMDVHGNLALMYGAHDPGCCGLSNARSLS